MPYLQSILCKQKQTEQSIEGQLRVCHEYAERHNLNIVNEYIDRALTGTNDHRPAFQQMIEDSKKQQFEFILVYKLDRFSRSKYDNAIYKHKLQQNGVKVISATESISNTPEGELMEGLLEMFAEMYVKDLRQKVKRGMRESMIKGNYLGGHVLYGYKVVDKKILIDEDKAPAIRYLFEEYAKGRPLRKILKELNDKGFRSEKGKPLCYNSFLKSLSNKKYIGIFDNGEVQNNNYYPAIVDPETFETVQKYLNKNKARPGKNKSADYLLSGKVFCGYCGKNLNGTCGTGKLGTVYYYYYCPNKKHNCCKKNEKKENLELEVVKYIQNMLTPENIKEIAKNIYAQYNNDKTTQIIKDYENQFQKIENELDKLFNTFLSIENEDMKRRFNEKADSLSLQKQDINTELNKLKLIQTLQHSEQDIEEILNLYTEGNVEDVNYQKKIIDTFLNAVYVYDDKLVCYFDLFKTTSAPTFEEHNSTILNAGVCFSHNAGYQIKKADQKSVFYFMYLVPSKIFLSVKYLYI